MNKQEILDTVLERMLEQGQPSKNKNACFYAKDGLQCAVGCLLPYDKAEILQQEISETGRGGWINEVIEDSKNELLKTDLPEYFLNEDNFELLCDLQNSHDGYWENDFVSGFTKRCRIIAKLHKLEFNIPDKFKDETV